MITEDYVSFQTAKLLKEKGFDYVSFYCYEEKGINDILLVILSAPLSNSDLDNTIEPHKCYSAPTLQMAMKWLREVHKIYMYVAHDSMENTWFARVYNDYKTLFDVNNQSTYEEACEEAIQYCLENLI